MATIGDYVGYMNEIRGRIEAMDTAPKNIRFINNYLAECNAKGYATLTQITFLAAVYRLLHFSKKSFKELSKDDMIAFSNHLKSTTYTVVARNSVRQGKYSPVTVEHTFRRLKTFFGWLNNGEFPKSISWFKQSKKLRNAKLPQDMFSPSEIVKLIEAADHLRDKAIVAVLYESACRAGGFLGIRLKDVCFDKYGAYIMVTGKTGCRRIRLIESVPFLQRKMQARLLQNWKQVGRKSSKLQELWYCNKKRQANPQARKAKTRLLLFLLKRMPKRIQRKNQNPCKETKGKTQTKD